MLRPWLYAFITVSMLLAYGVPERSAAQGPPVRPSDGSVQLSQEDLRKRHLEDEHLQQQIQTKPEILIDGLKAPEMGEHSDKKVLKLQAVDFANESSVISVEELEEIVKPFLEQTVSLQDLYEIAHRIDVLYDEKGVLGRVQIPPQDVKNGTVLMRFIEGKVGGVQIKQRRAFSRDPEDEITIYDSKGNTDDWQNRGLFHPFVYTPHLVANQFSFESGDLIQTHMLEDELLRYNMLNDAKMQLELQPGEKTGESDLVYHMKTPPPMEALIYADNFGRPTTGEYRTGAMLTLNNLSGLGDRWFVNAVASPDGDMADTYIGTNIPLSSTGLAFIGSFEYTNYALVDGEFSVLDVDGWSRKSDFGFSLPLWVSQEHLVRGYVKGMNYDSQSYFSGTPQQDFNVLAFIFGVSHEHFGKNFYHILDTSISTGREINANDEHHRYTLWRGSWTGMRKLSERWSLLGRLGFQIGSSQLPSIEMFQIGGIASVRGYTEGMLAGDAGYYLNLELHRTLYSWQYQKRCIRSKEESLTDNASVTMFTFADHGGVFPYKGAGYRQNNDDYLVSTGLGWTLTLGKHFGAKALVSFPLYENHLDSDYKDARCNFMAQYKF